MRNTWPPPPPLAIGSIIILFTTLRSFFMLHNLFLECVKTNARLSMFFIILLFSIVGCTPATNDIVHLKNCDYHCSEFNEYLLKSSLGLDPTNPSDNGVLEDIHKKNSPYANLVEPVSIDYCLDSSHLTPEKPILLKHASGHTYFLLSAVNTEHGVMYQLVHGISDVILLSKNQLKDEPFTACLKINSPVSNGIPIRIGTGMLKLDKVFNYFAKLVGTGKAQCRYSIKNTGETAILIGRPEASCSCTVPEMNKEVLLESGESHEILISVSHTTSRLLHETIDIKCTEPKSKKSKEFKLFVFGHRVIGAELYPSQLDFGTVGLGETSARIVTLSENNEDQFEIKAIDVGDLPITFKTEASCADSAINSLKRYKIHFDLKAVGNKPGNHLGEISIVTTSARTGTLVLPIMYEVAKPVQAVPSTVAFAQVGVGDTSTEKIQIITHNQQPVSITVDEKPIEIDINIHKRKLSPITLELRFKAIKSGINKGMVKIRVKGTTLNEVLKIPYVIYVN